MNSKSIVIIDYQLGNLFSVKQALNKIGVETTISSCPEDIISADAIVLPGVGAFTDAMSNLTQMGFIEPIKLFIKSGKPFLGICLGLQLLFSESEEFEVSNGLNIIKGKVQRFKQGLSDRKLRVPQISWNQILKNPEKSWEGTPLFNIQDGEYFYFVHSYYVVPEEDVALSYTIYGDTKYVSSIIKDNIFACQFHPEKSAEEGLLIYKNWAVANNLV